ncbi:MAG TPA: HAMP domain-containing sensor histidine kinase [Candidimonas sp.]|nr:HAMP domain-containing sensor histidine kinase [Candidimonas sp.]
MMKSRHSLTQRVTWALTGSAAMLIVVLCAVFYLAFDQMEDDMVDAVLSTEADHLMDQLRQGLPIPKEQSHTELGALLQSWLITSPHDNALLPEPLRQLEPGSSILTPEGKTWHIIVADTPTGRLYLRYDATVHEARVHEFGWIVLALGSFFIVLAFALAKWLGSLVVGPVVELTDRLSAWAPGAPDIAVRRDDEVGRLVEAFNRVQNRVEESMAFEREFSSNLSHEVRTALMAIRSDSELLLLDAALEPRSRQRLQRIGAHVDTISSSLASAESLTRQTPAAPKPVHVKDCVAEAWMALEAEAARCGLVFVNDVPDSLVRLLDPYALLMVARNLIRNAVDHAAPAALVVSQVSADSIAFADSGPGIDPDALPLVFERYFSSGRRDMAPAAAAGSNEHAEVRRGLGLAIAKQVCERNRWVLTVQSQQHGPHAGTVFTLHFDQNDNGDTAVQARP